jgi:hypothetical protein
VWSTRVVRGAASPLPALFQPRGGIEGQRELGLSALLSTISNTRHGHSPHSNTLRAAFRAAPVSHGVSRIAMLEGPWAGQGYVYSVEHSHTEQLSLTATRWCPQRVVAGARRPHTSARHPSSSAPRFVHPPLLPETLRCARRSLVTAATAGALCVSTAPLWRSVLRVHCVSPHRCLLRR